MAHPLDVSHRAITVPEIDSYIGLTHTLFVLEDMCGLKIGEIDREVCLRLDKFDRTTYTTCLIFTQGRNRLPGPYRARRDNQRRIRPVAVQIFRIRYLKTVAKGSFLTRTKRPYLEGFETRI